MTAEEKPAFVVKAGACIWSLGYLSQLHQLDPAVILALAHDLQLEPLSIDGVPFLLGPQADLLSGRIAKIREMIDTKKTITMDDLCAITKRAD